MFQQRPSMAELHMDLSIASKVVTCSIHGYAYVTTLQGDSVSRQILGIEKILCALISRTHEGLVYFNRDSYTLSEMLLALLLSIIGVWQRKVPLMADDYYASGKLNTELLRGDHHLVPRARIDAVVYRLAPTQEFHRQGRLRLFEYEIWRNDLTSGKEKFPSASIMVYRESNVILRFCCLDPIWRPAALWRRFVFVRHTERGTSLLTSTDRTLVRLRVLTLNGCRFKIELGSRQAIQIFGTNAYHLWMGYMKLFRRGQEDLYSYRISDGDWGAVGRKEHVFHLLLQLGYISQGAMRRVALNHLTQAWCSSRSLLRNINFDARPPNWWSPEHCALPPRLFSPLLSWVSAC